MRPLLARVQCPAPTPLEHALAIVKAACFYGLIMGGTAILVGHVVLLP